MNLIALGQIGRLNRQLFGGMVIGLTGSAGKTTTRRLLEGILSAAGPTHASAKSFNNDIGVPLSLLGITPSHRAAVLEAGTNHPGELAPLIQQIAPRYGLVPQIGREHLEHFGDLNGVVDEECALGENLPADGILFLNGDCEAAQPLATRLDDAVEDVLCEVGRHIELPAEFAHISDALGQDTCVSDFDFAGAAEGETLV